MSPVSVLVKRLPHNPDLPLPSYETGQAAGLDVPAAVDDPVMLAPGERAMIPTGLAVAVPEGYEIQMRPRSGLAIKHGVILPNAPGTIDADYRGEVKIILLNLGQETFVVTRGMRIAQMIVAPVCRAALMETDSLPETERGSGGFGSTG